MGRFSTLFLLREIVDEKRFLIPDFSAGFQYRFTDEKDYFIKANISRNSKMPSMNDMFWAPGGNPDLKNEYAFIYELSYEMTQKISAPVSFKYSLTGYRYYIKNLIQWHPGEFSYWTADNIRSVNSTGIESSVSLDYAIDNINVSLNTAYSFNKASAVGQKNENDVTSGKQLIYVPENQVKMSLRIDFRKFYSNWTTNFTGKRYVAVDNSDFLPGYLINNFNGGIRLPLKSSLLELNFSIDNIFNTNYQSIAFYPLPGRSYNLKILVQIVK
jgi:iron complex outermembrane receptor protein